MSLQATADNKGSAPKSYARRDHLAGIEKRVQKKWEDPRVYEADIDIRVGREKYLITFPYPYMNGRLHLGHAFSMTKVCMRSWNMDKTFCILTFSYFVG